MVSNGEHIRQDVDCHDFKPSKAHRHSLPLELSRMSVVLYGFLEPYPKLTTIKKALEENGITAKQIFLQWKGPSYRMYAAKGACLVVFSSLTEVDYISSHPITFCDKPLQAIPLHRIMEKYFDHYGRIREEAEHQNWLSSGESMERIEDVPCTYVYKWGESTEAEESTREERSGSKRHRPLHQAWLSTADSPTAKTPSSSCWSTAALSSSTKTEAFIAATAPPSSLNTSHSKNCHSHMSQEHEDTNSQHIHSSHSTKPDTNNDETSQCRCDQQQNNIELFQQADTMVETGKAINQAEDDSGFSCEYCHEQIDHYHDFNSDEKITHSSIDASSFFCAGNESSLQDKGTTFQRKDVLYSECRDKRKYEQQLKPSADKSAQHISESNFYREQSQEKVLQNYQQSNKLNQISLKELKHRHDVMFPYIRDRTWDLQPHDWLLRSVVLHFVECGWKLWAHDYSATETMRGFSRGDLLFLRYHSDQKLYNQQYYSEEYKNNDEEQCQSLNIKQQKNPESQVKIINQEKTNDAPFSSEPWRSNTSIDVLVVQVKRAAASTNSIKKLRMLRNHVHYFLRYARSSFPFARRVYARGYSDINGELQLNVAAGCKQDPSHLNCHHCESILTKSEQQSSSSYAIHNFESSCTLDLIGISPSEWKHPDTIPAKGFVCGTADGNLEQECTQPSVFPSEKHRHSNIGNYLKDTEGNGMNQHPSTDTVVILAEKDSHRSCMSQPSKQVAFNVDHNESNLNCLEKGDSLGYFEQDIFGDSAEVGADARPIHHTNVGYQMLLKLGWQEGSSVGHRRGLTEPIRAKMPLGRIGLGMTMYSLDN
eukprot:gene7950-7745_t